MCCYMTYILHLASTVLKTDCEPFIISPQIQRHSGTFEDDDVVEQSFPVKKNHLAKQID